ncbi:MAG: M23 family metallopeptidase [Cyanobium sp.]
MAPQARTVLIALGALALLPGYGSSMVLAQAEGTGAPTSLEPAAPPAPPPPVPAPVIPAPVAESSPDPLLPGPEQRLSQPPRQFDRSLDQLVRDRVVSPAEADRAQRRIRVHTNGMPVPVTTPEACSSGAFSQQECSGSAVAGTGSRPAAAPGLLGGEGTAAGYASANGSGFSTSASPLAPISVPVSALLAGPGGNFRLTDVFRRTPRPAAALGNGNRGLLFPLIGSAVTSSGFGWRLHPVIGSWLMHAGKDLAAPEGTPVVAALSGKVVSSGLAGGYGLAIELEHDNPRRRTLYGHLSELYVREGQSVRQGEVIGRVGSTGLSTGPHLHFELRLPQEGGWVAVDPGEFDPGTLLPGGTPGQPGGPMAPDAVAMLVGQLVQTLERPQNRVGAAAPAKPGRALPLPPQRAVPAPTTLPARPPRP